MDYDLALGVFIKSRFVWHNRFEEFMWYYAPCWLWNILSIHPKLEEVWNGKEWINRDSEEGLKLLPLLNITLMPGESASFSVPINLAF